MKKKIVSVIAFLSIIFVLTAFLGRFFADKTSWYNKSEFFNAKTGFDALFFGSSRMHEAADPIYLWENYGIASYNLSPSGESIQMTYYVLSEALENCHPKMVFVDASKISEETGSINSKYGFVHESIDALPLNKNKLEAIDYASNFFEGGRLAFISMLYAYHDRYDDLRERDFTNTVNYDKGAYIMTSVMKRTMPDTFTDKVSPLKDGDGVRYYKRILDLCRNQNVICVLTDIPVNKAVYDEERQMKLNALKALTEEKGGKTILFNIILDEINMDYDHDFGDASHLNFMGAKKVCDYLAGYMKENGVKDHRDDPDYSVPWTEDIEKYKLQRIEKLDSKEEAVAYLFGAMGGDNEISLYIRNRDDLLNQYGMDICLEMVKPEIRDAGDEELGGFDMKIEVRSGKDGSLLAGKSFEYNIYSGMFLAG